MTVSDIVIVIDCLFTFVVLVMLVLRSHSRTYLSAPINSYFVKGKKPVAMKSFFYKNTVVFILTFKVGYISCFDFLQNL